MEVHSAAGMAVVYMEEVRRVVTRGEVVVTRGEEVMERSPR